MGETCPDEPALEWDDALRIETTGEGALSAGSTACDTAEGCVDVDCILDVESCDGWSVLDVEGLDVEGLDVECLDADRRTWTYSPSCVSTLSCEWSFDAKGRDVLDGERERRRWLDAERRSAVDGDVPLCCPCFDALSLDVGLVTVDGDLCW
ncbi:hypothetical protein NDU88_004043 [Pleurodeles waltl]|uniref:Uncharacterized protein n=1 Tax=Pleurodeles waltl TaxID=8319 RepID=A0AAV7TQQ2_PLEWA|nr:hypothetical protein NDU88_004043 [Pleurodeles waltl]